jgi:hypothetical protein
MISEWRKEKDGKRINRTITRLALFLCFWLFFLYIPDSLENENFGFQLKFIDRLLFYYYYRTFIPPLKDPQTRKMNDSECPRPQLFRVQQFSRARPVIISFSARLIIASYSITCSPKMTPLSQTFFPDANSVCRLEFSTMSLNDDNKLLLKIDERKGKKRRAREKNRSAPGISFI